VTDGYAIVSGILAEDECSVLISRLDAEAPSRSRAGARHLMDLTFIRDIASDERLKSLVTPILGHDAVPFKATLFDKSSGRNWLIAWHQDTALPMAERSEAPGWGPWSMKDGRHYAHAPEWALRHIVALRIHLDESGPDNGPLRVIPGSQHHGLLTDAEVFELAAKATPVECCVQLGGVLVMDPLIIHASSKSESDRPRRVLHIEYSSSMSLGQGLNLAIA
jgi:ectoine hydroxylase-related dioxygenase (phytanoyl-CoA dioxygenase family)